MERAQRQASSWARWALLQPLRQRCGQQHYPFGDMPHSTSTSRLTATARVIYTGASDIGQGSDTMVAQIVAEVLGIA